LSNNSKDPTFRKALANADEALKNTQTDYVTLFFEEWSKIADEKKLAQIYIRNQALRDVINVNSSDEEIRRLLRQKADETVKLTFNMLKQRIDRLGVAQPNVSLDNARDLILVELPGIDNPQRARNFLQASAKLEFWDVYRVSDPGILEAFIQADDMLDKMSSTDTTAVEEEVNEVYDTLYTPVLDSLGNVIDSTMELIPTQESPFLSDGPLLSKFVLNNAMEGSLMYPISVMGVADKNKMKVIDDMLGRDQIKSLFPRDLEFKWSYKPFQDYETNEYTDQYMLYAIKKQGGSENAPIEGDRVISASASPDPSTGEIKVNLRMDVQGAKKWADMTTKAAEDNNREIAIVLDDEVVSAPGVRGPITGGSSEISGNFTVAEANDFASILEIGKLPANTKIIQEATVGPSLGAENIARSINSLLIGFILVIVFMIVYYGGGGIVAIIALFTNLFFIFGALASFGTVLTLPGIAGIILTIGMAVDANVIIFERVREELRAGKSMLASVKDGFMNSYSAIIDANVTTILVAFVLSYFGLGPIKGFAVVLIIGVLSSLFTAVLFGKLIIDWWTAKDKGMSFWTPISKTALSNLNIKWIEKRKIAYVISAILILAGMVSLFTRGLDLGVDFKGGFSYTIEFKADKQVDAQTLRDGLTEYLGGTPVIKAVDAQNTYNIVTDYLINDNSEDVVMKVSRKIFDGLDAMFPGEMEFELFLKEDAHDATHIISSSQVGPTIADDIKKSAFYAALFALLVIFIYIFVRFNKWQYSLGAVAALFHDSFIILGLFSLLKGIVPFSIEIDQAFIAAILTVIGYSINDTVVVFDRIREDLGKYTEKTTDEVLNIAINATFSRTLITSLTTGIVVLILFLFGGSSIKGFSFAILIGIFVGTYSSIFVATPIVRDLAKELKPKKHTKKAFSRAAAR
jgi:SecD/SecF fusion protein